MRHYLCVAVLVCSSAGGKGHGKALAEAASAAPAETGGKVNHVSCSSGLTGDFVYETCASFCKEEAAETHCKFCKCKSCTFCGGTTHPKAKSPHSHLTAKKSKASSPKDEGHTSQLRSMAKDEGQSSAPHKSKTKKARPTSSASAGEPTASTAAAAALAVPTAATAAEPVPSSSGWTAAAAVVTLAAVVALYMSSRSSGRELEQVQTRDAELEASAPTRGLFDESALKPAAAGELGGLWSAEARVRTLCVALLCMQYAAYALLRRYSTGILKEPWSAASVLGAGEAIKFGVSLFNIGMWPGASEAPQGSLSERMCSLILDSGKMAVPAFIYLAMNFLGFVSLSRVDAGTFAIVQQSKVFFTAALQRLMLGRTLSVPKWGILTTLVLGVCLISLESQPSRACAGGSAETAAAAASLSAWSSSAYAVGVAAVFTDSALSGFATVYFEKMLKTTRLTVWDRNLQLAFWSMLIYLPWALYDNPSEPFFGWSAVTAVLALLGALGGILVALVIKHADGLAKNLATASSIVLTTGASHLLFSGPMSAEIILGCLVVVISGFTYQKVE